MISCSLSSVARAELTIEQRARIGLSVETCESRAFALNGTKWTALAISSVATGVMVFQYFGAMMKTSGELTAEESRVLTRALVSSVAGAAVSGLIKFYANDVRQLGRLAAELGYDNDGLATQGFFSRCLKSGNSAEVCKTSVEALRAEAKAGTMCNWKMINADLIKK